MIRDAGRVGRPVGAASLTDPVSHWVRLSIPSKRCSKPATQPRLAPFAEDPKTLVAKSRIFPSTDRSPLEHKPVPHPVPQLPSAACRLSLATQSPLAHTRHATAVPLAQPAATFPCLSSQVPLPAVRSLASSDSPPYSDVERLDRPQIRRRCPRVREKVDEPKMMFASRFADGEGSGDEQTDVSDRLVVDKPEEGAGGSCEEFGNPTSHEVVWPGFVSRRMIGEP
jgi:hypothetical protein